MSLQHTSAPAQKGSDFYSKHPPAIGEEPCSAISPTTSTSRAKDSVKPVCLIGTGLAQSPSRASCFIKSKAPTVVYTILHDPTHLPSTPLASCSYIPATLTNLFREHTCLRAFALAASPTWNVPPPQSCLTLVSFPPSSGQEKKFSTHPRSLWVLVNGTGYGRPPSTSALIPHTVSSATARVAGWVRFCKPWKGIWGSFSGKVMQVAST